MPWNLPAIGVFTFDIFSSNRRHFSSNPSGYVILESCTSGMHTDNLASKKNPAFSSLQSRKVITQVSDPLKKSEKTEETGETAFSKISDMDIELTDSQIAIARHIQENAKKINLLAQEILFQKITQALSATVSEQIVSITDRVVKKIIDNEYSGIENKDYSYACNEIQNIFDSKIKELIAFNAASLQKQIKPVKVLGQGARGKVSLISISQAARESSSYLKNHYAVKSGLTQKLLSDAYVGAVIGSDDKFLNIIGMLSSEIDGSADLLMDWVDGETLAYRGISSYNEVREFLSDVNEGYQHALSKKCIPHDVHGNNVMIVKDEKATAHKMIFIDVGDYKVLKDELSQAHQWEAKASQLLTEYCVLSSGLAYLIQKAKRYAWLDNNDQKQILKIELEDIKLLVENFHDRVVTCIEAFNSKHFTWNYIERDTILQRHNDLYRQLGKLDAFLKKSKLPSFDTEGICEKELARSGNVAFSSSSGLSPIIINCS